MPSSSPDVESRVPPPPVPPLNTQFVHVPERPSTTQRRRVDCRRMGSAGAAAATTAPLLGGVPSDRVARPATGRTDGHPSPRTPGARPRLSAHFPVLTLRNFAATPARTSGHAAPPLTFVTQPDPDNSCGGASAPKTTRDDGGVSWTADAVGAAALASGTSRGARPALLAAIERHVSRELAAIDPSDDLQCLRVFREAFVMFAEGFRTYAPMLSRIMAAYDRVIQQFASTRATLEHVRAEADERERAHSDQMAALTENCERRAEEAEARLLEFQGQANSTSAISSMAHKDRSTLQLELDTLHAEKAADLRKMLLLVKAVKEGDLRLRTLTYKLQQAQHRLEEAEKTKRMLAESQEEIGKLKDAYQFSVPLQVHAEMSADLMGRLEHSQAEMKRYRRMFASRGSQLHSALQIVAQLREEKRQLHHKSRRKMTPRPDWEALDRAVPELRDAFARTDNRDMTVSEGEEEPATVSVEAPTSTEERVRYLSTRVSELTSINAELATQVATLRGELSAVHGASQRASLLQVQHDLLLGTATAPQPSPPLKVSMSMSMEGEGEGPPDAAVCCGAGSARALVVARGLHEWVPAYLRKAGIVAIFSVPQQVLHSAILKFARFIKEKTNGKDSTPDIPKWFSLFVRRECSGGSGGANAALFPAMDPFSVAYSLVLCAELHSTASSAAALFVEVLHGSMPVRLLYDCVTVLDNVAGEVKRLAAAQRRQRIRKGAITEVLGPLLSFKSKAQLDELKTALGVESTVDGARLIAEDHPFTQTLIQQACSDGPKLFGLAVRKLCARESDQGKITKRDVVECLRSVEPLLPLLTVAEVVAGPNGEALGEEDQLSLLHVLERVARLPIIRLTPPPPSSSSATGGGVAQTHSVIAADQQGGNGNDGDA